MSAKIVHLIGPAHVTRNDKFVKEAFRLASKKYLPGYYLLTNFGLIEVSEAEFERVLLKEKASGRSIYESEVSA